MKSTKMRGKETQSGYSGLVVQGRTGAVEQSGAPAKEEQKEDQPVCHLGTDGAKQVCVRGAVGCIGGWESILPSK